MRKGYFGETGQQIHYRESGNPDGMPLMCLAPAPHSGLYFARLQEALPAQHCISVDYPGYGGSDFQGGNCIEHYAESLVKLIESLGMVHLLGFHSGCLVAIELARKAPLLLDKVILVDVPFFDDMTRKKYAAHFAPDLSIPEALSDLEDHFTAQVIKRKDDIGLMRAFDLWVETLRAGVNRNAMFQAAFAYDVAASLKHLNHPVHMIATQSSLLELTRRASELCENANLIERLDIDKAVFDKFAVAIGTEISAILES